MEETEDPDYKKFKDESTNEVRIVTYEINKLLVTLDCSAGIAALSLAALLKIICKDAGVDIFNVLTCVNTQTKDVDGVL